MSGTGDDSDTENATTAVAPTEVQTAASNAPAERRSRPDSALPLDLEIRIGGRYVIKELLGQGGMGAVYRVFDETLGEDVALKVVRSAYATDELLRDEVRLAQRVTHRNVCRIYDLEDIGSRYFLKMEYIAGETLATRLQRSPRLPVPDAVRIAREIATGLAAAHAEGIVHRDLKPGNVMLAGDRVVLMDFGLALRPSGSQTDRSGTPGYMSPEQLAGRAVDARSDLYALGCVAYELITGERVADSTDVRAKRPDAPGWLARAIDELLALEPVRRTRGAKRLHRGPRAWKLATAITAALVAAVIGVWWAWPHATWRPEIETILPIYDENSSGPVLSPDGKTILFDAKRADAHSWGIYSQSIEGGQPTQIAPHCTNPHFTAKGTSIFARCDDARSLMISELALDGTVLASRGSGFLAKACGDDAIVIQLARQSEVVRRTTGGDISLTGKIDEVIDDAACSGDGDRVAYTVGEPGALYLWDRGTTRQLVPANVDELVFTPGGTSIVFVRRDGQVSDLFEIVLGDLVPHQLTSGAQARAPDISRDGSVLVFDEDITSEPLFEYGANERVRRTFRIEKLAYPSLSSDGTRIIATSVETRRLVLVDLADGSERDLWPGQKPVFSLDGTRVLYLDPADPLRVLARRIDAPTEPPVVIASFAGGVADLVVAVDGLHVLVQMPPSQREFLIGADGTPREEYVDGLVVPSRSGWRAVVTWQAIQFVAPGKPLSSSSLTVDNISLPAWVNDHVASYCDRTRCHVLDVETGHELSSVAIDYDGDGALLAAPDGKRWFATDFVAHVVRKKIANFASRPWAP